MLQTFNLENRGQYPGDLLDKSEKAGRDLISINNNSFTIIKNIPQKSLEFGLDNCQTYGVDSTHNFDEGER